jgi:hypothetical protein
MELFYQFFVATGIPGDGNSMSAVTCNCPTIYISIGCISCNFVELCLTAIALQWKAFLVKPFLFSANMSQYWNYIDNKRNFSKTTVLLCGIPRHHTSV